MSDLNVETVGGYFEINSNPALQNIGLNDLLTIGGDLIITGNNSLTELGFDNLDYIGGSINISNNEFLLTEEVLTLLIQVGRSIDEENVTVEGNQE